MSWDYAVWHTTDRLRSGEAQEIYVALCGGDTSGVVPSASIDAFYAELTALHPELDDVPEDQVDDTDLCPWSVAHDRSAGHVILCCVLSKGDYVGELVLRLASKHGLTVYDPQAGIVYDADGSRDPQARPWWRFW